jgi:hypothetical protein
MFASVEELCDIFRDVVRIGNVLEGGRRGQELALG